MKTLTLSLLVLALTACTANPTKTPAPVESTEKIEEQKNSPATPNSTNHVTDAQASSDAQKETPANKKPKGPKGTPAQAAKNCVCVKMWMPVCGANDKTYGNSCEAECAGVKYTQGACEAKK